MQSRQKEREKEKERERDRGRDRKGLCSIILQKSMKNILTQILNNCNKIIV